MPADEELQAKLKTMPDEVRRLGARVAMLEDRLEVHESRRTTWIPSRSYSNLTGRQREVVFFIGLCLLGELIHLMVRKMAADAPPAP